MTEKKKGISLLFVFLYLCQKKIISYMYLYRMIEEKTGKFDSGEIDY